MAWARLSHAFETHRRLLDNNFCACNRAAIARRASDFDCSHCVCERFRDFQRKRGGVRVMNIRRDGHDDAALGKRHERRNDPAQRVAVVADRAHVFTASVDGLEVPAKTVTSVFAPRQSLWRLE